MDNSIDLLKFKKAKKEAKEEEKLEKDVKSIETFFENIRIAINQVDSNIHSAIIARALASILGRSIAIADPLLETNLLTAAIEDVIEFAQYESNKLTTNEKENKDE